MAETNETGPPFRLATTVRRSLFPDGGEEMPGLANFASSPAFAASTIARGSGLVDPVLLFLGSPIVHAMLR